MKTLRAWMVCMGAICTLAFAACGDDDNGTSPQTDGGSSGTSGTSGQPGDGGDDGSSGGPAGPQSIVLLHTNDLHGHLEGHEPELDYTPATANDDTTKGGFARLAAHIAADRAAAASAGKGVVLADAGDWMMGTGFSSFLGIAEATEIYEMTSMGYDATTLGNHEFDFTSLAVAGVVQRSIQRGKLPPIVATNMNVPTGITFRQLIDTGLIAKKKVITTSNGVKIGFVGIMGKAAAQVAPLAAPVTFDVPVAMDGTVAASIQSTVDSLHNDDKVDIVIALSHSGTDSSGNGEDHDLAAKSKGIDIIVSGHTHVELPMPVTVTNAGGGNTYIVSTGAYGLNLGHMELTYTRGKGLAVDSYALEKIDDSVVGDANVQKRIDGYVTEMNTTFTGVGLPKYFDPVGGTGFDLPNTAFVETNLGDLVTDSYLGTANALGTPTQIAVEANGNIRAPLLKGKTGALAFADVFNVEPLGIGPDQKPGYPLVVVYLTAQDIVNGLKLSAAAADPASSLLGIHDDDYFIQVAGVKYVYDLTHGTSPLSRLTHVDLCPLADCSTCTGASGSPCEIYDVTSTPTPDNTIPAGLHPTVMTLYLASLFGLVNTATGGALTITPKDPTGTAYNSTTLNNAILTGPSGEVKNWQALVGVISKFPSGGSGPVIPASYANPAGRITKK